jgi:hypothetical protein
MVGWADGDIDGVSYFALNAVAKSIAKQTIVHVWDSPVDIQSKCQMW